MEEVDLEETVVFSSMEERDEMLEQGRAQTKTKGREKTKYGILKISY